MGYGEYLKRLLRPLRLYDLDSGAGALELCAIGAAMDQVGADLALTERESAVVTAESGGLEAWENVLPFSPRYLTLSDRRNALTALMRIDGAAFTPGALNDTLAGCGLSAEVDETDAHYTVSVSFPKNRGVPEELDALKERIEAILPCHLDVEYNIILITWAETQSWFPTWQDIRTAHLTWDGLERYLREG